MAVLGLCCFAGFSLVVVSEGYSSLWCSGFSCGECALGHVGSVVAARRLRAQAQYLWCRGLVRASQVAQWQRICPPVQET